MTLQKYGSTSKGSSCPALGKKCEYCGKQGHFARMCLRYRHMTEPGEEEPWKMFTAMFHWDYMVSNSGRTRRPAPNTCWRQTCSLQICAWPPVKAAWTRCRHRPKPGNDCMGIWLTIIVDCISVCTHVISKCPCITIPVLLYTWDSNQDLVGRPFLLEGKYNSYWDHVKVKQAVGGFPRTQQDFDRWLRWFKNGGREIMWNCKGKGERGQG